MTNPAPSSAPLPRRTFWRANLMLLGVLLSVWFAVSFGFGIVLRPLMDRFEILGVPAGFWFAQQGATYVFISLIFAYAFLIGRIERRHGVSDDDRDEADGA